MRIEAKAKLYKQTIEATEWAVRTLQKVATIIDADGNEMVARLRNSDINEALNTFQSYLDRFPMDNPKARRLASMAMRVIVHGHRLMNVDSGWTGPMVQVLHEWETRYANNT